MNPRSRREEKSVLYFRRDLFIPSTVIYERGGQTKEVVLDITSILAEHNWKAFIDLSRDVVRPKDLGICLFRLRPCVAPMQMYF